MSKQKLEQEVEGNRLKLISNESLGQKLVHKYSSPLGNLVIAESCITYPPVAFDLYELKPLIPVKNLKSRENLLKVITSQNEGLAAQAYIYLAYLDFIEDKQPLETIQKCNFQDLSLIALPNTFGLVTVVMYYTIYTWIYISLGDAENALKQAQLGHAFVFANASQDSDAFFYWQEALLFTLTIILRSSDPVKDRADGLEITNFYLKRYQDELISRFYKEPESAKVAMTVVFEPKDELKAIALLHSLDIPHPFQSLPNYSLPKSILPSDKLQSIQQLLLWLPIYETLTEKLIPFPKGENQTILESRRHARVLKCFDWWVRAYMSGRPTDDGLEDLIERHYKMLEILYRGTFHSFHSLSIMRNICHCFYSLISIANYNVSLDEIYESRKAVECYMFDWETKFTLLLDQKKKDFHDKKTVESRRRSKTINEITSHRLSGQITQIFDVNATEQMSKVEEKSEESGQEPQPRLSMEQVEQIMVIDDVDGESIADSVGVLITGMRLMLIIHEGNVKLLQKAATYGEKAYIIVTEHGALLPNYAHLLSQVYQWLGVVYGELALEVVDRTERVTFQNNAATMLSKARNWNRNDPLIRYQLALQYAELGEFQSSIDEVNKAINLDPTCPSYYNLLALLLSSKSEFETAANISLAGWKRCVKKYTTPNAPNESMVNWDGVDYKFKEDLINLRFTFLSLELERVGAAAVMESLQSTFALLRKIIGHPPQIEINEAVIRPVTGTKRSNSVSTPMLARKLNGLTKTYSSVLLSTVHHLTVYQLPLTLWLSTSSLYRKCNLFDQSLHAIQEAERILATLSQIQHLIRNQDSKLFKNTKAFQQTQPSSGGYWKEDDPVLAALQADIALEKAFLHYHRYKQQLIEKPESPYLKYLSPVARVEAERQALLRKTQRIERTEGSSAIDSISITPTVLTDVAKSMHALNMVDNVDHVVANSMMDINAYPLELTDEDDLTKTITLDQVIAAAQFALVFDLNHLPARAFLGLLYKELGDFGQSEHHLQKVCTQQPRRGVSSGKTGLSSVFGGYSSDWGWYSWQLLASCLTELGRDGDAHKAALYSLQLRQLSCTRGYEALPRF